MTQSGILALCLSVGVLILAFLVHPEPQPGSHTVKRIEGMNCEIERFDEDMRLHGLQQVFINGVINHERMVEHGQVLWRKEYDLDGKLIEHWVEGSDYILTVKDQID